MFQQIGKKKSLSQQVVDEITRSIRDGEYMPGQQIPTENTLCEIFNVSRTAIREAIKVLTARGMVEVRKGSGAFVTEVSVQNAAEILNMFFELSSDADLILQTIETRQLLEPQIAREAAEKREESHVRLLEKNMQSMQQCPLASKKKEADLDNEFHRILLNITGNKVLELLLSPVFSLMPKFKVNVFAKPEEGDLATEKNHMLQHHGNILKAIKEQDPDAAEMAMRDHLKDTWTNYHRSLKTSLPRKEIE
ncbi:FadR family transcriptional regulator [Echinicola marina]|uniref:FadR/GntR family transcriptional regulator n=1 Tax=Echinicola marina TaxID=2859768 RepID=UPI001CF70E3F|nr:FadR/GntR family transcriptional regulator [Echinicola marina]UCS91740.1 FadR family transcriptional regulator [Echinicola marina]